MNVTLRECNLDALLAELAIDCLKQVVFDFQVVVDARNKNPQFKSQRAFAKSQKQDLGFRVRKDVFRRSRDSMKDSFGQIRVGAVSDSDCDLNPEYDPPPWVTPLVMLVRGLREPQAAGGAKPCAA